MAEVLIPRLPDTTKALDRKYTALSPILSQLPPPVTNSLLQFDAKRAVRGAQPLSETQTLAVLRTALTGTPSTPPPTHTSLFDIPRNAVTDLRTLVSSIPRLPAAIFREAQDLTQLPQALQSASQESSPFRALGKIAEAPGIRLLPGTFTLSSLAQGEASQAIEHPLFTFLDLLPAAKSRTGQKALSSVADTPFGQQLRQLTQGTKSAINRTQLGQFGQQAFGRQSRELSGIESLATERLRREFDPSLPDGDLLSRLGKRANALRTTYSSIPESRRLEITRLMQEDPAALSTLNDVESAFVTEYKDVVDGIGREGVRQGFLATVDGEMYDPPTAKRILGARAERDFALSMQETRNLITTPITDVQPLIPRFTSAFSDTSLTKAQRSNILQGLTNAVDAAGYDTTALRKAVSKLDQQGVSSALESLRQSPYLKAGEITDILSSHIRTDPSVTRLSAFVKSGDYRSAARLARTLRNRTRFTIPAIDHIHQSLTRLSQHSSYLTRTSQFSDRAVTKVVQKAEKIAAAHPPDRFLPAIQSQVRSQLLEKYSTHPDFDSISQHIIEGNYSLAPAVAKDAARLTNELKSTWQELRDNGFDPVFVHRVSPERARQIDFPRVLESVRNPSWVRRRTNDLTPHVQDATVAVSHQALELLARRASEQFVDTVTTRWGRTQTQLLEDYLPAARARAQVDPRLDTRGHAQRLIAKEWVQYDPKSIVTWSGAKLTNFGEPIYLPKPLANNIKLMHSPPTNRLTSIIDPIMKTFRISLLPLSPRWHVNNIVGGGMMLAAESPSALRYLSKARALIKEGKFPVELPEGFGSIPRDALEWDRRAKTEFQFRSGTTLRRLYDEAGAARELASKGIQKSYAFNAFFDDTYRAAAYLSGKDKALLKGLSESEAHAAGIQLTRKIFQNWDEMTPLERTVMRYVFPFYGFVSHIMRYVLRYPFDHPIRAEVMGAFTRNEIEDGLEGGLPDRFLNSFFLGEPDEKGNVKAINLGGINPFGNVADYFTLAGFTRSTNPVISTLLQSMGVDPMTGGPELFPNLSYDAETGRLVAKNPGLISGLIGNVVPQSKILMGLLSSSSELKELMRVNPEAASRLLRSQAGLPIIYRNINVPQEQFRAELSRGEAQQEAFNAALKSGNFGAARAYPQLRGVIDQIQALQNEGRLESFTPPETGDVRGVVRKALVG